MSCASFSTNEKQNQNQSHHVYVIFPALRVSYRWLLGIVIGSPRCSFPLWLVEVIALVLVFRQSFENRSIMLLHTESWVNLFPSTFILEPVSTTAAAKWPMKYLWNWMPLRYPPKPWQYKKFLQVSVLGKRLSWGNEKRGSYLWTLGVDHLKSHVDPLSGRQKISLRLRKWIEVSRKLLLSLRKMPLLFKCRMWSFTLLFQ